VKQQLEEKLSTLMVSNTIKTRENRTVEIDVFLERFKGVTLTYDELIRHENCVGGWEDIFNIWKEKGLI